jgi:two-component system sensor histidine kinase EvgS
MKKYQNNLTDAEILRQKAEAQFITQQSKISSLSTENDLRKLAHELQVHKIELEMQYEQLKQAKEEADASTRKYTELYNFAPSGLFTLTEEGKIIGLNLKGSSMLGKERLLLINRRFGSSVSDQTKSIFNNFLDKVFTSKGKQSCEVTLSVESKNIPTYVYLTGHVLENGEQCQISVVDITEHKLAGDALRESEESYRKLFENHSAVKIILDPDTGAILDANDAAAQYYGWTREELKYMKIYQINTLSPEEVNVEMERTRSERRNRFEFRHRRADGSIRDVEVFSSKIEIRGKDVFHSIIQDITERKRAELELILANKELVFQNEEKGKRAAELVIANKELAFQNEEKEKRANELEIRVEQRTTQIREINKNLYLEIEERKKIEESLKKIEFSLSEAERIAKIGNWEWDMVAQKTKWSDNYSEMLGLKPGEVEPSFEYFISRIHPDDIHFLKENHEALMQNKNPISIELRLIKSDGSIEWIRTQLELVLEDDKIVEIKGVIINITENKKAEDEIKKARTEAEQANLAKSEFLANMSHEIRTPMNAVLGYTELLSSTIIDQTQKDYINSIKSSGKGLLTLINDILDLSKIEAGKFELEFDYVDTYSFFSEFERIFSLKVSEKGLKFILDITSGIPAGINIDETRLRQIVFNLIGNAIKFTEKGSIKLRVYTENPQIISYPKEKSGKFIDLIVEVSDTGIGISKEIQEEIFNPFVQGESRSVKKYGGTGLGLAITKRLVQLMNGTITLDSQLNNGSSFKVKIPGVSYLRDFNKREEEIQIDPSDIIFEAATIIVADDVEHNRKYLVAALRNTNIKLVEAEDGQQALTFAKRIVPDLIITDIKMPVLDGFDLLKKLKSDNGLKHIPVIAYTASGMKAQINRIRESEFAGLLIKPVDVTKLYLELMKFLPFKSTKVPLPEQPVNVIDTTSKTLDLPGLIHSLDTQFKDVWMTFGVRQPINEVLNFGKQLESLGKNHNAEIISKYGEELARAASCFNIESVLNLIRKYPGIIELLKSDLDRQTEGKHWQEA